MIGESQKFILKDDYALLDKMLVDSGKQNSLYRPGPYWAAKTQNAAREIRRCGLSEFRGANNHIGLSFTDSIYSDIRYGYNHASKFWRLVRWATERYPVNRLFDAQVGWTTSWVNAATALTQELVRHSDRVRSLLDKYAVPHSLLGGCLYKADVAGVEHSILYLMMLEYHDTIASRINFSEVSSVFEIGGGFGANVHLLLENYSNIRKVLYLDIPPNLYVGTQYLKALYGDAVKDYSNLESRDEIAFSNDDELEIYCIAPWQIEKTCSRMDVLMNTNSFVEMPREVVGNYVQKFEALPGAEDSAVALTTYDGGGAATLPAEELPKFFSEREFEAFAADRLLDSSRENLYFVSPGKFSR